MNTSQGKERWIHCYNSSQKILLVGEGDFSFSGCLARAFGTAENMVATSYLSEDWLVYMHRTSVPHLDELKRLGALLLYEVDVHKMKTHPILRKMKFDVIIFNFPHAGHFLHLRERSFELIEKHRKLVGGYFKSASKMLNEGGEVHLRHRDDHPYASWNVVNLAGEVGLMMKEKVPFLQSDYPGYQNSRGSGDADSNKTFPILCAFTFKFVLDLPKAVNNNHPKKDEVNVLQMKNQGHADEVHVVEVKDEDDHGHKDFKGVEVSNDLQKKDEVSDDRDRVDVEIPKNEVVDDLIALVLEKKINDTLNDEDDVLPTSDDLDDCVREMKVGDNHLKIADIHVDLVLPKIGDGYLNNHHPNKDEVEDHDDLLDTKFMI